MRIIFFGTPEFVVPVLQSLNENFEVVGVVTSSTSSPIAQSSARPPLAILTPEKLDQKFINNLQTLNPELFIIASYGKIIPQAVLDIPKFGSLNIHPSLLPKYRGPSPIQSVILNGDKISGVSILVVDYKMDHGPIVTTKEIRLSNTDTFDSLSKKMFVIGAELLIKIIPDYVKNKIKLIEQNHEQATFTKMFTKEDGYFDISKPPTLEILDRMIRAYYPWPTAWTRWNNKIVKFLPYSVIPAEAGIHGSRVKHGMTKIEAQNDKFLVQMEGKKPTKLADFLHGYPTFPIKNLI